MNAEKQLIYKDDARRAVLRENPSTVYCIDRINPVDAAEVVRCKDCRYYSENRYDPDNGMWCKCWSDWLPTDPDDFCSNGERRESK